MTSNDFGDCSNQTLRTINFQLKDSNGNDINLHGNNWSFSKIFSRMEKIYSFFYYVIFTKILCNFYKTSSIILYTVLW